MLNLFKRLFKVLQSHAHSAISKFEDPIKLAEQGIRDLQKDLEDSMKSLAEIKALNITLKRQLEENKQIAVDYERKAMLLLQKAQNNELNQSDGDRLASEALVKKNQATSTAVTLTQNVANQEKMISQLEDKVKKLKTQKENWQNELSILKARAKVASSTRKINQQLSQVNSDSTIAMLENMKTKVAEEEALAQAYDDMTLLDSSVDSEINKALEGSANPAVADSLAELKARLITKQD
jgi:phage shock protein A